VTQELKKRFVTGLEPVKKSDQMYMKLTSDQKAKSTAYEEFMSLLPDNRDVVF